MQEMDGRRHRDAQHIRVRPPAVSHPHQNWGRLRPSFSAHHEHLHAKEFVGVSFRLQAAITMCAPGSTLNDPFFAIQLAALY